MFKNLMTIPSFTNRLKLVLEGADKSGQFDFEKWYGLNGDVLMHRQGYIASAEHEEEGRTYDWMRFPQEEVTITTQWLGSFCETTARSVTAPNVLVFEQQERGMHDMAALAALNARGFYFDSLSVEFRTVAYDDLDSSNSSHWFCAHLIGFPNKQTMLEFAVAVKGLTALEVIQ